MLRSNAKTAVLVIALGILVIEGFLLIRWYDRYYIGDASATSTGTIAGATTTSQEDTQETTAGDDEQGNAGEGADEATGEISFTHTAIDGNSRGDYTYIGDPAIDGNSEALVLAFPVTDRESAYAHNIGVWYEGPGRGQWAIFNQDLSAVPEGAAFEVVIPPASESFVHRASPDNTWVDITYLDDPLTNKHPDATVSVTQNWNPGGGKGVYNDHPTAVFYDKDVDQWAIYNQDGAPIPDEAAFNVAVSESN